jgi:hypothetical protein
MERKLSSRLVPVLRWLAPPLWVLGCGAAIIPVWPESGLLAAVLVAGWAVSSAAVVAVALTLKEVSLRGDRLVIRGWRGSAEAPVSAIREAVVDYSLGAFVILRIEPPCAYGGLVSFVPELFPPSRPEAVAAELRTLARPNPAAPVRRTA